MNDLKPLISVITVNYNSESEILKCYKSIEQISSANYELILVSNSPLNSSWLAEFDALSNKPHIIESGKNLGFAKACNLGAEKSKGHYLFFLNPDTYLVNDALSILLDFYLNNKKPGVIGPKTLSASGKHLSSVKKDISGYFFLNIMLPFLKYILEDSKIGNHYKLSNSSTVEILNGHALFISKSLFYEIGKMHDQFFMYWEENDICLKARKSGFHNYYCIDAEVVHFMGTSTNPYFLKMEVEKHKSQKDYVSLHHPKWRFINRVSGIIGYFIRMLGSIFTFNQKKIAQHSRLFYWYCFEYE